MEIISGKIRNKVSNHDAKRERRKGFVPGVLYGKNMKNILFEMGEFELNTEINRNGEHGRLDVQIEGEAHKTLIKEVQRDPVNQKILHIDLEEINKDTVITTEVPVVFTGEDMVLKKGGYVQKEKDNLKIKCMPDNIPSSLKIDLEKMQVGDTYKVADVEFGSDITIMDDLNSAIVTINENNNKEVDLEEQSDNRETEDIKIQENS